MSTAEIYSVEKYEYWISLEEKIDRQNTEIKELKKMVEELLKINRIQMRR